MRSVLLAAAIMALAPLHVLAQGGRCNATAEGDYNISNPGTPFQTAIIKNGELICPNGVRIKADVITTNEATGIQVLQGNARFSDSTKTLTADFAQYHKNDLHLDAHGNVILTDRKTGSTLRAPNLDYYKASRTRKDALGVTNGGRAHAILKPEPKPGAKPDSTMVDADVIELRGERIFRGLGTAIITRTDLRGYGNTVDYDQDRGNLLLAVASRIVGDKYTLQADTINAIAAQGEQLREVRASRDSRLVAEDVRVESPFLRIYLDSGKVNRLVATRPASRPGVPVSLPRILSKTFNVSADSIDALAPHQQMQRVDAVGHAFGERIDSLPGPEIAQQLPNILTNDWLRGDTLHAVFVPNPDAKPDSAGQREPMLQSIVAIGKYASSILRMKDQKDSTWRIYYALAQTITVDFDKGKVADVRLKDSVSGLMLAPANAKAVTTPPRRPGGRP